MENGNGICKKEAIMNAKEANAVANARNHVDVKTKTNQILQHIESKAINGEYSTQCAVDPNIAYSVAKKLHQDYEYNTNVNGATGLWDNPNRMSCYINISWEDAL